MLKSLIKLIMNIIFLIIVVVVAYIIAFMFNVLPEAYTPSVLFKDQYTSLKKALANDAAANDATSKMSKMAYDYLTNMEKSNKPQPPAPAPAPPATTVAPQAPTGTTTAPGTATPAPAGTQPQQPTDAVTKAKEAAQDYQNKMDQEKKKLDSL